MKRTTSLQKIKQSLQNGNLCILPTDTILGIFTEATNNNAVQKIFTAKQRDFSKPLAIFISLDNISKYAIETEASRTFTKKNLPGAYTILLYATEFAKANISPLLISHDDKIGIRIPMQRDILQITQNMVMCGTSVNVSGQAFAKDVIPPEIAQYVDLHYASTEAMSQIPSTIIDFTHKTPITVR
jgi:L-threonylcarbamoyladenylate synthase